MKLFNSLQQPLARPRSRARRLGPPCLSRRQSRPDVRHLGLDLRVVRLLASINQQVHRTAAPSTHVVQRRHDLHEAPVRLVVVHGERRARHALNGTRKGGFVSDLVPGLAGQILAGAERARA